MQLVLHITYMRHCEITQNEAKCKASHCGGGIDLYFEGRDEPLIRWSQRRESFELMLWVITNTKSKISLAFCQQPHDFIIITVLWCKRVQPSAISFTPLTDEVNDIQATEQHYGLSSWGPSVIRVWRGVWVNGLYPHECQYPAFPQQNIALWREGQCHSLHMCVCLSITCC